jgi:ankyrin repeat protein
MTDNAAMYPMINQIYKDFDHLSLEEKHQLFAKAIEEEEYQQPVPEFEADNDDSPRPPGIINRTNLKGTENATSHNKHVCFDPLALLLDASLEGELDLVKRTARQVPDPSAANDEGITALHNAICAGHLDIVKFLVEFGCDVNAQDSDGWTPLHCAASCNNLPMVRFLVEHGACIFATTFSDQETAAEKCEEDEEGFAGCSEYLYSIQEKLGIVNDGKVFALYDHNKGNPDELSFEAGQALTIVKKGDDIEREWWWAKHDEVEGYVPRNFLGLCARVEPPPAMTTPNTNNSSSMSEESDSSASQDIASSNTSKKINLLEATEARRAELEDKGHSSA